MAILNRRASTQVRQGSARFFDNSLTGASRVTTATGIKSTESQFINLNNIDEADSQTTNTATFSNRSFATAPSGFAVNQSRFQVYVNGLIITESSRTVAESGSDIVITFTGLGYNLDGDDKILLVGKFS